MTGLSVIDLFAGGFMAARYAFERNARAIPSL
jgi:hypothetical protein